MLHQHLDSVSSQAERIRQTAESSSAANTVEESDDSDTRLSELRSVIAFLRKEKDIVDLQLELSKQENARLKAQVERLSESLEDTRRTLSKVYSIFRSYAIPVLIRNVGARGGCQGRGKFPRARGTDREN